MKPHNAFKDQVSQLLEEQLKSNNPAEVKETLTRLISLGWEEIEAKTLMVRCLSLEVCYSVNNKAHFNEKRYVQNLLKLPGDSVVSGKKDDS
jgi:hypothetical protein